MENEKPLILVTNDDGVMAKGISALIKFIRPLGEIIVMAPDSARSGMSGAITVKEPIHYQHLRRDVGLNIYKCSGTPVDCVKLALDQICTRKPDLFIAGINHGDNSATNVYNSGTMGATIEACLDGITSIAFSLCDHQPNADFEPMGKYIRSITQRTLKSTLPELTCLNINFPNTPEYQGVRICNMARGRWTHEFDACPRPNDSNYFWLGGEFAQQDETQSTSDRWALNHGFIAVTPTRLDVTDYTIIDKLKEDFGQLL